MVIEFNGLPGMGKTTVTHALNDKLCDDYNVRLKYCLNESRIGRLLSYLFDGSAALYVIARKYTKYSTEQYKKEKLKYIGVLISYYRMYKQFLKKHTDDILIIDQGIIQALISIHHDDLIVDTKYLKNIFCFLHKRKIDVAFVNCGNDESVASQRIKSRNTFGGRVDVCEDDERERVLKIQARNFDTIRSECSRIMNNCKTVNINMSHCPDENSDELIKALNLKEGCK